MVGKRRGAPPKNSQKGAGKAIRDASDIYQDMLEEAGVAGPEQSSSSAARPLKRRRVGGRADDRTRKAESASLVDRVEEEEKQAESQDDEDVEFHDVVIPAPTVQTIEQGSDEEDDEDEEDMEFEDVDPSTFFQDLESTREGPKELELNLTAQKQATTPAKNATARRKPITREGKEHRMHIHKVHLLCLLSHAACRNHWCNDAKVQEALRPHLTEKMIRYLTPGNNLSQFGRTESLKSGLKLAMDMWKQKFEITERGIRRALWAEDAEHLKDYELPSQMETCLDREDFREAAKKLQGSRDVGAQLFCALLRSAGVRARLVCSLQPLSFASGAPTLPRLQGKARPASKTSKHEQVLAQITKHREMLAGPSSASSPTGSSARRRLGHPNATAYNFEPIVASQRPVSTFWPKRIRESSHPVYWIEILDVGHQKWQPIDPVVTLTFWKPRALEPPLTNKANFLCYVVAFDGDHTAKDVTRRYAKVYTAKTLKMRVERGAEDGEDWWRKVMEKYQPRRLSDLDQIEDIELTGVEAREPMPRNVQDFKNHPVYALERHLLRHQVLAPGAKPSGTVSAGSRAPLEKVYRRKDVLIARSTEKWFRLGRQVKTLEIPVTWLPKRPRNNNRLSNGEDEGSNNDGDAGTPIYTRDQTELYVPPPVREGKVPKNKFGNVEVYTPSMVPEGGVHIIDDGAVRAAYLLGIDYAPALTDFRFTGKHGTAVLRGAVVAQEFEEAMRAVIQGLDDLEQEIEDDKKRLAALTLWRRFLMGLRIRERIWSGVNEEERREADREAELEAELREAESDETEEIDMVEDDDDDDDGGGGFLIE